MFVYLFGIEFYRTVSEFKNELENPCLVFTQFHVMVVQGRQKNVQKRVKLVQSWFHYQKLCSHYTGQIFVLTRNAIRYSVNTYPICDYPVWFSC